MAYAVILWKTYGSKDERTMVCDSIRGIVGPFDARTKAVEYLKASGFEKGDGFYVSSSGDRPGDAENVWWHAGRKQLAAEIHPMVDIKGVR